MRIPYQLTEQSQGHVFSMLKSMHHFKESFVDNIKQLSERSVVYLYMSVLSHKRLIHKQILYLLPLGVWL